MTSERLDEAFYKNLAKLFYAMAMVDRNVRKAEKWQIKEIIDTEWNVSEDSHSKEIMFSKLKSLFERSFDQEEAYQQFKAYFLAHQEIFTTDLKRQIMAGINKIADAYAGRNKSESILVSRLYFLMWNKEKA